MKFSAKLLFSRWKDYQRTLLEGFFVVHHTKSSKDCGLFKAETISGLKGRIHAYILYITP